MLLEILDEDFVFRHTNYGYTFLGTAFFKYMLSKRQLEGTMCLFLKVERGLE